MSSHNRFGKQVSIPQRMAYRVIDRELAIVTSMMKQTTFSLYCRSTRIASREQWMRTKHYVKKKKQFHRCTD